MISSVLCCEQCNHGPIDLSTNFSVIGTRLEQLYIKSDQIFINNNETKIKFFDNNSFKCSIYLQEIVSVSSLRHQSRYVQLINGYWSTYQADWAYTIVYNAVGNKTCSGSNYYQLTLITNQHASFILIQYYESVLNNNFYFGIESPLMKKFYITNHSELISNSNIGIKGKWIYLVDKKNKANSINCSFKLILLILVLICFNKNLF